MGTSTSNAGTGGAGTPLIPSWVDSMDGAGAGDSQQDEGKPDGSQPPIPPPADAGRYTAPRAAFSRFARSGGTDRKSMGRAVAGYVSKTSSGPRGAMQRMGSSRASGARLLSFFTDIADNGIEQALSSLNLDSLVGRSAEEVLVGIADYIFPEGGNIDVAIPRDAYFEMLGDLMDEGIPSFDDLNSDQVGVIFKSYVTYAIEKRILNEIGGKAITLPNDTDAIDNVHDQLHDFIGNGVSDAVTSLNIDLQKLSQDKIGSFVDNMFEESFRVLAAWGESMENEE